MRDFQHLDLMDLTRGQEALLHQTLGIARQHHVELPAVKGEHDARVVGSQLLAVAAYGPLHLHHSAPKPPRVPRLERPYGTLRPGPATRTGPRVASHLASRGRLLSDDIGDADPVHFGHADKTACSACVVPVGMREHEHVDPAHAAASQRTPKHQLVRAGVDQHHPPAVAHEDRIPLPDIEHRHRAALRRRGAERDQHRAERDRRQEPTPRPRLLGQWPPQPQPTEECCCHHVEPRSGVAGNRGTRHTCHHVREMRSGAKDGGCRGDAERAGRGEHRPGDGACQPDEHRDGYQRTDDRIRHWSEERYHPERRCHHRYRGELCHERERQRLPDRSPPSGKTPGRPLGDQAPEHEQPEDSKRRELQTEIEHRPRLQPHHHDDRRRQRCDPVGAPAGHLRGACDRKHQQRPER